MADPSDTNRLDSETVVYLHLAAHSVNLNQLPGCVRFLTLALDSAARAGLIRVAEECRILIRTINPYHLLATEGPIQDQLHKESVSSLVKSVRRLCPLEQAEMLADNTGFVIDHSISDRGDQISQFLHARHRMVGPPED